MPLYTPRQGAGNSLSADKALTDKLLAMVRFYGLDFRLIQQVRLSAHRLHQNYLGVFSPNFLVTQN
jgi:hypothetical protein